MDRSREQVVGVLLAGGTSRRMGRLKQLLPFGNHTVIEQCLNTFRESGVSRTYVVLGFAADLIRMQVAMSLARPDVTVIENRRYDDGMLSSAQVGLRAAREADGVLLGLVDQPFIPPTVFKAVIKAFQTTDQPIVVPRFGEKNGHPIALSTACCDEILAMDPHTQMLRDYIRAHENARTAISVDACAILRDMNDSEAYQRELAAWESGVDPV
ncbi:MAG: nucleotidyltransferase family protein [Candidatus Poribacteria bacterium]|nr:nucleotidyltransferase family protein [Candidatus Poribacteria bacterium]